MNNDISRFVGGDRAGSESGDRSLAITGAPGRPTGAEQNVTNASRTALGTLEPQFRFGRILETFSRKSLAQIRQQFQDIRSARMANGGTTDHYVEGSPFRSGACSITLAHTPEACNVTFEHPGYPEANLRFVLFWEGGHYALFLNRGLGDGGVTIEQRGRGVSPQPMSDTYGYADFIDEVALIVSRLFPSDMTETAKGGTTAETTYTGTSAGAALSRELVLAGERPTGRTVSGRFEGSRGFANVLSDDEITNGIKKISKAGLLQIHGDRLPTASVPEGQRAGLEACQFMLTDLLKAGSPGRILVALSAGRAKPEDGYIRFVRKNPENPSKLQAKTIQLAEIDRCFDELRSGRNATLSRIVTDLTGFYGSES